HRRLAARFAPVERKLRIDVGAVTRGEIVVLPDLASSLRIPQLGHRIAGVVKPDDLLERVHGPVVEEDAAGGKIAQGGGLEQSAELVGSLVAGSVVGPERAANSDIEVLGVAVRRDVRVARHADRLIGKVGEKAGAAIEPSSRKMTRRA